MSKSESAPLMPVRTEQRGGAAAVQEAEKDQQQLVEAAAPAAAARQQRGIAAYLTGEVTDNDGGHKPKRQKKEPEQEQFLYGGDTLTIVKGQHAAEDKRWVIILEVKDNGTKQYKCVRCGHQYIGKVDRIISHCLRLGDGKVAKCTRMPTEEQADVLGRLQNSKPGTLVGAAAKSKAVARTPSVVTGLSAQADHVATVDMALAKLIATKDLPWSAFDSRNPLWRDVVAAIQAAGPTYKPADRLTLSEHRPRAEGARPGGLHLALESTRRERCLMLETATGELSTGGTLVSDGAKLTTRKRGMLNTSLVMTKGVLFLQSTDATGKTKNGEFLRCVPSHTPHTPPPAPAPAPASAFARAVWQGRPLERHGEGRPVRRDLAPEAQRR